MGDIAECRCLLKRINLLLAGIAFDHFHKDFPHLQGLFFFLSDNHAKHDICGSLGNRASVPDKCTIGNRVAIRL